MCIFNDGPFSFLQWFIHFWAKCYRLFSGKQQNYPIFHVRYETCAIFVVVQFLYFSSSIVSSFSAYFIITSRWSWSCIPFASCSSLYMRLYACLSPIFFRPFHFFLLYFQLLLLFCQFLLDNFRVVIFLCSEFFKSMYTNFYACDQKFCIECGILTFDCCSFAWTTCSTTCSIALYEFCVLMILSVH